MRINLTAAVVAGGLCLLVAGLIASVAQAATVTVTWTNPTANTDGSALPATQITRTTVVWGASASALTGSKVVTGSASSTTIDLAPGTWFVAARTTANGNDSALSTVVQHIIVQPTPNPPTGLSVVAVVAGLNMSPAYKILDGGERSQVVAGFVPVGTACDDGPVVFRYRDRAYRRISAGKVQWWNPPLADVRSPPPVAAPCA
jgi:hypothetical protein